MTRRERFLERLAALRAIRALPALALLAVAVLGLTIVARRHDANGFDLAVTHGIQGLRSPALDQVIAAITFFGNTGVLVVLAVAAAFALKRRQRPTEAWLVALSLVVLPLNVLLKLLIARPRPPGDLVEVLDAATGLSFPSGHAMGSAAVYGCLAFAAWTSVSVRSLRSALVAVLGAVAIAVGLSRVYLGVHWFSDVLGGWAAGLFFVTLFAAAELPSALSRRSLFTWRSSASKPG
jgi:undecaprenyl-diphosphatase